MTQIDQLTNSIYSITFKGFGEKKYEIKDSEIPLMITEDLLEVFEEVTEVVAGADIEPIEDIRTLLPSVLFRVDILLKFHPDTLESTKGGILTLTTKYLENTFITKLND